MGLYIDPKLLTPLTDSVSVGILPFNPDDQAHWQALKETIYGEALIHGESLFNEEGFEKVIAAAGIKKIIAEFIVAKIENCDPLCAGGAIRIPSIVAASECDEESSLDEVFYGEHAEDTNFPRGASKILRDLTINDNHPKGIGLGTWYMGERSKRGIICTSEYAENNLPIIKTYKKFPTSLGLRTDSAVFQVTGLALGMRGRLKIPVETDDLTEENGNHLPNIFLTSWSSDNGKQKITALFTDALSTYSGDPIVRVQIVSHGHLPNREALKDILTALIIAGQNEVQERRWAPGKVFNVFGGALPTMCIHVLKNQKIMQALQAMEVPLRILGGHIMRPALMGIAGGIVLRRPLFRTNASKLAGLAYHGFERAA